MSTDSPKSRRRGSVTQLSPGVWEVRLSLGINALTGQRVRRKQRIDGTKREAEQKLTELLKHTDDGKQVVAVTRQSLSEWLFDEWLPTWCKAGARTRHDYKSILKRYLPPTLLGVRLTAVTDRSIQDLLNEMASRGLSSTTLRLLRAALNKGLNEAVKRKKVAENVVKLVVLPSVAKKREMRALTPDQARTFLKKAEADTWYPLWMLLLTVGVRIGEALALTWADLIDNRLAVRRALVRIPGQGWDFEDTKTGKDRMVILPASVVAVLAAHRKRQQKQRKLLGADYRSDLNLVFATATGTPLDSSNLTKQHFQPILERAKLPHMRLYDLRHTAATLRLANGEHPKIVSEMLGHSSVLLTLDTYSHVTPGLQEAASERLEALLFADQPAKPKLRLLKTKSA